MNVVFGKLNSQLITAGSLAERDGADFPDVCRYYLGRVGEGFGIGFSVVTLLGAAIVYWVLMSNFLYNSVTFIYGETRFQRWFCCRLRATTIDCVLTSWDLNLMVNPVRR